MPSLTEIKTQTSESRASLSDDGYVRLTLEILLSTAMHHFLSGLDEGDLTSFGEGATCTSISGYTEWISTSTPVITIGWDWQLSSSRENRSCFRTSVPRSNIMLVDKQNNDLGQSMNARAIEAAIDTYVWQDIVLKAIARRYA